MSQWGRERERERERERVREPRLSAFPLFALRSFGEQVDEVHYKVKHSDSGMTALFNNQNYAGSWFCIIWPLSLAALLDSVKNKIDKYITLSFLISITIAIILTTSRILFSKTCKCYVVKFYLLLQCNFNANFNVNSFWKLTWYNGNLWKGAFCFSSLD